MEYETDLIKRILEANEYDLESLDLNKIRHVPMHDYRVTNEDKTMLLIENLQVCIGLYAYGNNYAFGAHINTLVFDNDEYELDHDNNPIYCNRCYDLFKELKNFEGPITEPFKIGIVFGVSPIAQTHPSIRLIYAGLKDVINNLNILDIPYIIEEPIQEFNFIIDAKNNCIITSPKIIAGIKKI